MTTYESIMIMFSFGAYTISLLGFIWMIVKDYMKKK